MRILFIHNNFPAQYRHIILALSEQANHQLGFITQSQGQELPGIAKLIYEPSRQPSENIHRYLHQFEKAVLNGQAVFRVLQQLKTRGFVPDVVCAHTGWGGGMFVKDIYPDTQLLLYCEWFTRSFGAEFNFDPAFPTSVDDTLNYRVSNAAMLVDLEACDGCIAPTEWQKSRFPDAYHPHINVLHDGIDTEYFRPQPGAKLALPNLDLTGAAEIVTYVARGMDSYRGFPQFIEAIALVLRRRPQCHVVVVGEDRVAYGPPPPGGKSYKDAMLAKVPLDLSRVHFTGGLQYRHYLNVLQASSVHVYLTRPFVLSWSLLESMATGCLLVASNTAPVREAIEHGVNGLLVDFFDIHAIADRLEEALDKQERLAPLREAARQTIVGRYALAALLPRHLALLRHHAAIAQGQSA
jgi:glycosyltransferase involved in cell wall biosynthesis